MEPPRNKSQGSPCSSPLAFDFLEACCSCCSSADPGLAQTGDGEAWISGVEVGPHRSVPLVLWSQWGKDRMGQDSSCALFFFSFLKTVVWKCLKGLSTAVIAGVEARLEALASDCLCRINLLIGGVCTSIHLRTFESFMDGEPARHYGE